MIEYLLVVQDSWGKSESGVFEGNVKWIGRYYQCRNAKGPGFQGKHFLNYYGYRFEVKIIFSSNFIP